jgi:hypothetical protein
MMPEVILERYRLVSPMQVPSSKTVLEGVSMQKYWKTWANFLELVLNFVMSEIRLIWVFTFFEPAPKSSTLIFLFESNNRFLMSSISRSDSFLSERKMNNS